MFLERFWSFSTLKIDFENQILALFDSYFWPSNKSYEKINIILVMSEIMASIWNYIIKFRWHDEKLTCIDDNIDNFQFLQHFDISYQLWQFNEIVKGNDANFFNIRCCQK